MVFHGTDDARCATESAVDQHEFIPIDRLLKFARFKHGLFTTRPGTYIKSRNPNSIQFFGIISLTLLAAAYFLVAAQPEFGNLNLIAGSMMFIFSAGDLVLANPLPQLYTSAVRPKNESYLPGFNSKTADISHGGEHTQGKRKIRRPLDPKQALHVVLRSSTAHGELSMLHPRHCDHIHRVTEKLTKRWGVRLYRYANVGNHIQLLIKVPSRAVWQRFLRELTGAIAIIVTGAKKGASLTKNASGRGFWDHLAFTRIVYFGRDFLNMGRYLIKNLFEAAGVPVKELLKHGYRVCTISKDGIVSGAPS